MEPETPLAVWVFAVSFGTAMVLGTFSISNFLKELCIRQMRRSRGPFFLAKHLSGLVLGVGSAVFLAGVLLSLLFTGAPVFGLLGTVFVPFLMSLTVKLVRSFQTRKLEGAALSFFHALLGLTQVGLSFPAALFQLVHSGFGPFSRKLHRHLNRYQEGKTLSACLARFRSQVPLRHAGRCIAMLEMAYENGLAIGPLLSRMLPVTELDLSAEEKTRGLRRAAMVQAIFACLVPWFLAGVMMVFQPALMDSMRESPWAVWLLVTALLFEAAGVSLIWWTSVYY